MARYKIEMPVGATRYKVEMPIGATRYKVEFPGGATTEAITIDMTGAPTGASWTLADTTTDVATGTASTGPVQYVFETYTLTWEDTAFPWVPPPPEGPTALTLGNPITFGPP